MSSVLTKYPVSPLSDSPRFSPIKSKSKSNSYPKKPPTVSKSQFKPQGPVVILKRPSSTPKLNAVETITLKDHTKSLTSSAPKLSLPESKKTPVKVNQDAKSNVASNNDSSLTNSATPDSKSKSRRRLRGKPRRNSVSSQTILSQTMPVPDSQDNQGSLSDGPFQSDPPHNNMNSIEEASLYQSDDYATLFNQDKKNQAALHLLESLLTKSEDISPRANPPPPSSRATPSAGNNKKVMASHLLINLLKPAPVPTATVKRVSQVPSKFYAGPQFKQAPNLSSLPLPPAMFNQA